MRIYSPIGSKQRFNEIFQRVNKVKLNEDILKENVIENAFNELKNNQLTIKQTNSQFNGNQNTIEIVTTDKEGSEIIFRFRLTGTEGDQEGVFSVDSAELINFIFKSQAFEMDVSEGMNLLTNFNKKYANEIADVIGHFVDFSKESAVDDTLYENAIKLIDKIPYKKGTEDIQTNKAYADEKPTNPELRVKAPELEKVVNEMFDDDDEDVTIEDDYTMDVDDEDPFALPPDYSNMKDPLGDNEVENEPEGEEHPEGEEDPEEQALFLQAAENLIARNKTRKNPNYFPTRFEIEKEVERLKKINQPQQPEKPQGVGNMMAKGKKRVYPAWADKYLPEADSGIDVEKAITGYYSQLTPKKKEEFIRLADELLEANIGVKKYQMPKEVYFKMVRELAMRLFLNKTASLNETEYSEEIGIGKEFKEQKKKQKVKKTTISEEENDGMSLEPQDNKILRLAQDKEERGEVLQGGKGDGKSPLEFEPDQILMGLEVEKEHTNDPMIAIEIVLDHLSEDPQYYTRKEDPEASAQYGAAKDAEEKPKHSLADILNDDGTAEDLSKTHTGRKGINRAIDSGDKEMTDVLLGYKPKNVGDDINEIVGASGAVSAVGGDKTNDDEYKKYQEYEKRDFNTLTDVEKEDYFKMWNKYKQK